MFYAGQEVTAGEMNAELDVTSFRAGQKVRTSVLDDSYEVAEYIRAEELNRIYGEPDPDPGPDPGDPDPGGTPANPAEALWIGAADGKNHFNLGVGEPGTAGDGWDDSDHTDYDQSTLEGGFERDPEFLLLPSGDVQFRVRADAGRTSSGTNHPRSELRELNEAGNDEIAWNGNSGLHYMEGRSRITHVTEQRPWICFFQIHDASSDLVRVQCQGSTGQTTGMDIVARRSPPGGGSEITTVLIDNAYDVGDWIDWRIEIDAGRLRIWLNDVVELDVDDMGTSGCYFKTGCYLQSSVITQGESPTDYGAVEMAKGSLVVWHTGFPNPTTPVFTG